jgi:serine/threonine protein kinase/Flp pilus assembly protein TadD
MKDLIAQPDAAVEALLGQIADEFTQRLNRGEHPDIEEYARRYPEMADLLRQILAALSVMGPAAAESAVDGAAPPQGSVPGCLGDFRILREVGRGGMGVVYEAEQISLTRRVALKVLPFASTLDSKQLQRFKNEAQAAAHLHHTNIVPVFATGCERGVHYYAMQYIEGQTLAEVIEELRERAGWRGHPGGAARLAPELTPAIASGGRSSDLQPTGPYTPPPRPAGAPPAETGSHSAGGISTAGSTTSPAFFRSAARMGIQAAEALEHAHQLGIVHRDIKPGNVLVDASGNVWITDFGLAHCQSQIELTMTGDLLGTMRYMSPEQALAKRVPVDHRTDVYSLGVTLYELVTLERAFNGRDRQEVLQQIAFEEPKSPSRINRAVPRELEVIILKAMAKNPAERFATAQEMADDLRRFLEDKPIRARRPTLVQRARKWARRHPSIVWAAALVLLMAAGLSVLSSLLIWSAYRRETQAHNAESAQHVRAQNNLHRALEVLDDIYLQVAQDRVPRDPQQEQQEHELLKKALTFYQRFADENSTDPEVALEVIRANRRVGDIQRLVGQHAGACKAYEAAMAKAEDLVKEAGARPDYLLELAVCHNAAGELLRETGELEPAAEHVRQAIGLVAPLAKATPVPRDSQAQLARGYHTLGMVLKWRGDRPAAEKQFTKAINLQAVLAKEFPKDREYRSELAQMHRNAGRWSYLGPGDNNAANEHLGSAIVLLRGLAHDFPAVPLYRQRLAAALSELATQAGNEEGYAEAIQLEERLRADFPTVPEYLSDLAVSYNNKADLQWNSGKVELGSQGYLQAHDLFAKLHLAYPEVVKYRYNLALGLFNCARVSIVRDRDFATARRRLHDATGHFQSLQKAYPDHQGYALNLVVALGLLSGTLSALGDPDQAAKAREQAEQAFRDTISLAKPLVSPGRASDYRQTVADGFEYDGDIWMKIGRVQEAKAAFKLATRICGAGLDVDPGDSPPLMIHKAGFLVRRAGLYDEKLGKADEARVDYQHALALYEGALRVQQKGSLAKNAGPSLGAVLAGAFPADPTPRVDLGHHLWRLGGHLLAQGRHDTAEKMLRQALLAFEGLAADYPEERFYRQETAYSHRQLAAVFSASGRPREAAESCRHAVAVYADLVARWQKEGWYRQELAFILIELANTFKENGHAQEAEKAYRNALAHCEKLLAAQPNAPEYRDALARSHYNLAQFLRNTGRSAAEAEKAYSRALAGWAKLTTDHPDRREYRQHLAYTHADLAWLLKGQQRPQEAVQIYRQGLVHWHKLVDDFNLDDYRWQLGCNHEALGHLLRDTGRFDEAAGAYRKALAVWEKLVAERNVEDHRYHLAVSRECLGHALKGAGRFDGAADAYRKALVVWLTLVEEQRHPDRQNHISSSHASLLEALVGRARQVERDTKLSEADRQVHARKYRTEAAEVVRDGIKRGLHTPQSLNELAWGLATNANADARDPAWAVELAKLAVAHAPDNAAIFNTLGTAYYRAGDWKAAIESLKQADQLQGQSFFGHDAFFIAMACWQSGDKLAARRWFAMARLWMERNAPNNEELLRFRAEAAALLGLSEQLPPGSAAPQGDRQLYTLILELEPTAAWAYVARGQTLERMGESSLARADYRQALDLYTRALHVKPQSEALLAQRASAHAELGEWKQAADDLEKVAAVAGGPLVWYQLALVRLGAKDGAGYRRACAEILRRFAQKDSAPYSDFALWGCIIGPDAASEYTMLLAWAEKLVAAQPNSATVRNTLGGALYRAGRLEDAARRLNEAQAAYAKTADTRTTIAYPWYFLAMTHQRLGNAAEARRWLEKANREADKALGRDAPGGPPLTWNRQLTLRLLRDEAEALITGPHKH